jgi:hypothetical protein
MTIEESHDMMLYTVVLSTLFLCGKSNFSLPQCRAELWNNRQMILVDTKMVVQLSYR